jgi:hypothetical protein
VSGDVGDLSPLCHIQIAGINEMIRKLADLIETIE